MLTQGTCGAMLMLPLDVIVETFIRGSDIANNILADSYVSYVLNEKKYLCKCAPNL